MALLGPITVLCRLWAGYGPTGPYYPNAGYGPAMALLGLIPLCRLWVGYGPTGPYILVYRPYRAPRGP